MDSTCSNADAAAYAQVPDEIRRLYDFPEAEWDLNAWKKLAGYLANSLIQARKAEAAALAQATSAAEIADRAIALQRRRDAHFKLLRLVERALSTGALKYKNRAAPKGRGGRPTRRTPTAQRVFDMGLHILAIRIGSAGKAARAIAEAELLDKGRGGRINTVELDRRQKTIANSYAKGKERIVARLLSELGPGPANDAALAKFDLLKLGIRKKR